ATGGAEAAAGQRPPFGRMLIDAIVEGNSVVVTVLAIVAAIVVGGLLIAFTDPVVLSAWGRFFSDPGNAIAQAWDTAFSAYAAMFEGSIVNPHTVAAIFQQKSLGVAFSDGAISAVLNPISETLVNATPLIFAGLSVALAFRAGLFNIGAESQFIGGAIIATWLGFGVSLPPVIHVVVCVLGAFVGGALPGWLVGFLKAATGAHEVIVTIMLNYVMADFLAWILGTSVMQRPGRSDLISPLIAGDAHLPQLLGSQRWHERAAYLDHGHADRRRPGRPGGLRGSPGHGLHPQLPELRNVRHRRDHRGPAGPGPAARRRARRAAVRRPARWRHLDAGEHLNAADDHDSDPVARRAVRRSAAAH